jgi:hypothetical protein
VGYVDTTFGNQQHSPAYQNDDVDAKLSGDGEYTVGWFAAGEWLAYTVNVAGDGLYSIRSFVGSALPDRTFHIEVDGVDATGSIAVPQFDQWDTYADVLTRDVPLQAGTHVLRVVMGPLDFVDFRGLLIARE